MGHQTEGTIKYIEKALISSAFFYFWSMRKLLFIFLIAINGVCFGQIVLSAPDTIQTCLGDTTEICVTANTNDTLTYYWRSEEGQTWWSTWINDSITVNSNGVSCNSRYFTDTNRVWISAQNDSTISDSILVVIIVNYLSTPSFGPWMPEGCSPFLVNFIGNVSSNNCSLHWDFNGDGIVDAIDYPINVSESAYQNYTYLQADTYDLGLVLVNEFGCSTSIYIENYAEIYPSPTADYTTSYVSSGPFFSSTTLEFTSTSVGVDSLLIWDFGDGQTSNDSNPTHTFNGSGPFNVTLQVVNVYGCSSFREKIITVSNGNVDEQIINGIEEVQTNLIEIYPNPTSGLITIKNNGNSSVSIYNTLGIKVGDFKLENNQLDLSYLGNGIYFLQITTVKETWFSTMQVIK